MGSSQSSDTHGEDVFKATGRRKKAIILERRNEFPQRLRHAIDEAASRKKSKAFLSFVQDAFANWLFEVALSSGSNTQQHPRGLNDERDTEEEVELALRFFPGVLCLRRYGLFPILWLTKSTKSVSFIPLFARLGVELKLFQESERGGLVFGSNGMDVFSQLAATATATAKTSSSSSDERDNALVKRSDEEQQEIVDSKFLGVIKTLKRFKLMTKSDIHNYKMIDILCHQSVFPEQRFRFLVHWDPSTLLSESKNTKTLSLRLISRFFDKDDIKGIRMLFDLSMTYYPAELGFLFDTIYVVDDEKKPSSFRTKKRITSGSNKKSRNNISKRRLLQTDDNTNNSKTNNHAAEADKLLPFENSTSLFEFSCDTYGRREVQSIIDNLLYAQMKKDTNFTRNAVVHAAASCGPSLDSAESIFLLMKKDPTLLQLKSSVPVLAPPPPKPRPVVARMA